MRSELQTLEERQRATQELLERLLEREAEYREQLEARLTEAQVRGDAAFRQTQAILRSRIWTTLVGASGLLLKLIGRGAGGEAKVGGQIAQIHCDEPDFEELGAISGTLFLRGWAVAKAGVRSVEVQAGKHSPVPAQWGLPRPDVGTLFPHMKGADKAGFTCTFDTRTLQDGPHTLVVRVISQAGDRHEISIPITVDHVHGFANPYDRWIKEFEESDPAWIRARIAALANKPLVSVLLPVHRTPLDILERTIGSVVRQSYPHWELCVVDDASRSGELDALLERYASEDRRIRVQRLPQNAGISAASNAALEMAAGEYVVLLDHDDELAGDALFYVVEGFNNHPDADLLYSDEDHMDEHGRRFDPFFKPDWSPDLILSENYVCHLMAFRTELARAVGGFRSEVDLSQDHDILLRMSRRARRIVHIPRILYHWRTAVERIDRASANESRAFESSQKAVEAFLREAGSEARVEQGLQPGRWRVRYPIPEGTRLSIIIASGGNLEVLRNNVETLIEHTAYPYYEIVVVDNSKTDSVAKYIERLQGRFPFMRYLDQRRQAFNYSRLNNVSAAQCESELLLFLNDDTRLIERDSITAMMELAVREEVGAVGAKLLYPDGVIQHAGVVMGLFGICGHAFKGLPGSDRAYFDFPDVIRNVSAVTAACLMTRRAVFEEVQGFDEVQFPVAYNDVDLCLKIGQRGYRVLYTPHAVLTHYEAFSKTQRDIDPTPRESAGLKHKWAEVIANDPFYSPNLSRTSEMYTLRRKGPARR